MPQLHPVLCFRATPQRKVGRFTFPFSWHTIDFLKQFPGCRYAPEYGRGTWTCAEEMIPAVFAHFAARGYRLVDELPTNGRRIEVTGIHERARAFQREIIRFMVNTPRVINSSEAGLGKTLMAIEALRLAGVKTALIVCPAVVRQQWLDELDLWWPGHPKAVAITSGAQAAAGSTAAFEVVSYELLHKLSTDPVMFDAMILDESHAIKHGLVQRTTRILAYAEQLRDDCRRIELTATPIDKPEDLWSQLAFLYPGRYGTFWQFVSAYCLLRENEYAPKRPDIVGVNPARMEELQKRLSLVMRRVTKREVADQLPPCITRTVRVKPPERLNIRELTARFTRMDQHMGQMDDLVAKISAHKYSAVVSYVENLFEAEAHHVVIFTHLRATTEKLAGMLSKVKVPVYWVHGGDPSTKRHEIISKAKKEPRVILVATMHSTGLGINLQQFPQCLFAELSYSLTDMEQAAGRPHRLSSQEPVEIVFFIAQGTYEEGIAQCIREKIETNTRVISKSAASEHIEKGLGLGMTDAEFLKSMQAVAAGMLEGDEYL